MRCVQTESCFFIPIIFHTYIFARTHWTPKAQHYTHIALALELRKLILCVQKSVIVVMHELFIEYKYVTRAIRLPLKRARDRDCEWMDEKQRKNWTANGKCAHYFSTDNLMMWFCLKGNSHHSNKTKQKASATNVWEERHAHTIHLVKIACAKWCENGWTMRRER